MTVIRNGPYQPMVGDPDDYRPRTLWRVVVDDASDGREPADGAFLFESCAVGDRIPVHRHDVDEIVAVVEGAAEYRLGADSHAVGPGDVVFIPAGTAHGTVNTGDVPLRIHAVFPRVRVRIEMLERNPAPGTEDAPPMTTVYDFRSGAVVVEGPSGR